MKGHKIEIKTIGIFALAGAIFFLGVVILINGKGEAKEENRDKNVWEEAKNYIEYVIRREYFPFMSVCVYKDGPGTFSKEDFDEVSKEKTENLVAENSGTQINVSDKTIENVDSTINLSAKNTENDYINLMNVENERTVLYIEKYPELYAGCGFVSCIANQYPGGNFQKAEKKSKVYSKDDLMDYEFLCKNFYIVDGKTELREESFRPAELWDYSTKVDKTAEGPQILIYHTHSQESFVDSTPGDKSGTIVGVGDCLTQILQQEYGYSVYHHLGEYDVKNRDMAYSESAGAIEAILKEYPQIQVVIDLHRDGVDPEKHLVTEMNGEKYAQIMMFNGVSYLRDKGEIERLPNPNLTGNLAMSLKTTVLGKEYYPDVFRKNYINAYRYNMQYCDKSMLIEIGAQTNTLNEVMNACYPLAHILDMVFTQE